MKIHSAALFLLIVMCHCDQSCEQVCHFTSYTRCNICYTKCNNGSFIMDSCNYPYCVDYNVRKHGKDSCARFQQREATESQCTQLCCGSPSYQSFTQENMDSCIEYNESVFDTIIIIFGVVGGIVGILVLGCVCFFCYAKKGLTYEHNDDNQNQHEQTSANNSYPCTFTANLGAETSAESMAKDPQLPAVKVSRCLNPQWEEIEGNQHADFTIDGEQKTQKENVCCICLGTTTDCVTDCGHRFHLNCLHEWVCKTFSCPMCTSTFFNPLTVTCLKCEKKKLKLTIHKHIDIKKYISLEEQGSQASCNVCRKQIQSSNRRFQMKFDYDDCQ